MLLCAALALLTACSASEGAGGGGADSDNQRYISGSGEVQVVPVADREPAPRVRGTSLTGERVDSKTYDGKVLVLNFWASWCAPCRSEAEPLQAVYDETKPQGVRFVGINFKDNKTNAGVFVDEFGLTYPSIYDQPGETALAFRGQLPPAAVPSTIVIDREGRIAARVIGETTYTKLFKVVRQVADE